MTQNNDDLTSWFDKQLDDLQKRAEDLNGPPSRADASAAAPLESQLDDLQREADELDGRPRRAEAATPATTTSRAITASATMTNAPIRTISAMLGVRHRRLLQVRGFHLLPDAAGAILHQGAGGHGDRHRLRYVGLYPGFGH